MRVFLLLLALTPAFAAENYGTSTAAPIVLPVQPGAPYLHVGPMLGHVGQGEARIWVKATAAVKASVLVSESGDLKDARSIDGPALAEDAAFTATITVPGLKPATRYYYSVQLDGAPALARPWPSFTTAPADGAKGKLRFAFGSCVGKEPWLDAATWADLEARTPVDLVLLLGDNHYANTTDPVKQRAAYVSHRLNPGFRALFARTPLYSIWDDHDFGPDNSDSTLKGKEQSLATFKEFMANPGYGQADDPGVYFKFSRGDVDFFMLDGRYHRSPNKLPDGPEKTMLGAKQFEWLKRELLASKAAIKVIGSGGEWQMFGSEDSWKSFARERRELFDFMGEHGIGNVLLLSGDRHFTAVHHVEGRFIEVCSGPLGSPNAKTKPSKEMVGYHEDGKMYCVFDLDTTGATPVVLLEIYEAGVGSVEKRAFTWEQVTGAAKIEPKLPAPKPEPKPAAKPEPKAEPKTETKAQEKADK